MGSQLGRWRNNCVEYPQQLAILNTICVFPTPVLGYTKFKRMAYKFIYSELHPQCTAHFSTSSPEFSTFLGYHRGFKKCRLLRELQHFPRSRHPPGGIPSFAFMSCFKFLSLENSLSNLGGLLTLSKLIFCWQIEFYILTS